MLQVVRPGHATDGLILDAQREAVVLGRNRNSPLALQGSKMSRGKRERREDGGELELFGRLITRL